MKINFIKSLQQIAKNTSKKQTGLIVGAFCLLVSFIFLLSVHAIVHHEITGDEPHYLLMDYSLIHDGDLNLKNNYDHQDYLGFYPHPGLLGPQFDLSKLPKEPYKEYSPHGVGVALFILPGVAIAKQAGAAFAMVLLASAVILLTWVWTDQATKSRKLAYVGAASLTVCYFFNGLAGYLYPDMLTAALSLVCLIVLNKYLEKPRAQILLGMALGFLLLIHFKNLAIIAPVLLVSAYILRRKNTKFPWAGVLSLLPFVLYFLFTMHNWFGVWNPNQLGINEGLDKLPFNNIGALLFDSNRGLLVYNPVLVLLFLGLPIWFRQNRKSLLTAMAVLVPSLGILCFYSVWYGGAAPTGRYIVDFLPAFIPGIGFAVGALKYGWQKIIATGLFVVTLGISLDATLNKFPIVYANLPLPPLIQQIHTYSGVSLLHFLPSYNNDGNLITKYGFIKTLILAAILVGVMIYGIILSKQTDFAANRHDRIKKSKNSEQSMSRRIL